MAPTLTPAQRAGLVAVAVMTAAMWFGEAVDTVLGGALDQFGIVPRAVSGLDGVVLAPLLHGGFGHLVANTVPFVVLGAIVALAGLARLLAVTALVVVVGGLGTWLTGASHTVHIGASGLVFGLATYLIARGVFARRPMEVAVSAVVLVVWGGTVLSGLLPRAGISWQGHLFGAAAGVLAAWLLHRRTAPVSHRPGPAGRGIR